MLTISENTKLNNYEGVKHSTDDLRRKYTHSILEIYYKQTDKSYVFLVHQITDEHIDGYIWGSGKWQQLHVFAINDVYIQREYPVNGLVQIGNTVFLLSRSNARQWRRGACNATIEITRVYGPNKINTRTLENVVFANAFLQQYLTPAQFAEYLQNEDLTKPKVVTNHLWMVSRDNYLVSLYFEDIFIGMCDKNLKYIPCKESTTLAEEILQRYGLQQI